MTVSRSLIATIALSAPLDIPVAPCCSPASPAATRIESSNSPTGGKARGAGVAATRADSVTLGPGNGRVDRSPSVRARPDDVVPVAVEVLAVDFQLS